ncbi:hypothetical protein P175DRAFT_0502879 [Aspergillus ochraceoroseus IBT 24754]|nr:uncharacterized protein P175DRAFT_0502879 [Aspergillus ochraceoroseus IBT 24754]PTU19337.1 hypothetical protein P175DRAFT_0502879 [Aspergillus ochraceoroseus IBT 24754]
MDTTVTAADDSQLSDNDGGERPVRNKLKETSITSAPKSSAEGNSDEEVRDGESSRESSRGRKRSFNDDPTEKVEDEAGHRRKRSRDSSTEETAPKVDEVNPLGLKKKRSREQLDKDYSKTVGVAEIADSKDSTEEGKTAAKSGAEGEPEKKRHRDDSQERDPAPIPSAFANVSSVSPFGSLGASASKGPSDAKPVTSASAFASSSLAAFAGSEKSPFGALASSTPSVFKSPPTSTPSETQKPMASGFAALGSGFSSFSGGFGAAGSGGGLTSFASPNAPSALGSSRPKAFGAGDEGSDEDEKREDDEESGPAEFAEEKADERFFERPTETGEEEEKTYFSCKAKLFQFSDKEWKERGVGTFKVNVRVSNGVEDKKAARMIMRADGVLRVMLNTPLFKGMTVGDASGKEPKSKQITLASLENGRTIPILLRTGSEDHAKELYHVLQDLLEHL